MRGTSSKGGGRGGRKMRIGRSVDIACAAAAAVGKGAGVDAWRGHARRRERKRTRSLSNRANRGMNEAFDFSRQHGAEGKRTPE